MIRNISSTNKKYSYKIILDPEKDAWNWQEGCNSTSHGMNWGKNIPGHILSKIKGKPKKEALEFIVPFLKQKYIDDKDKIQASTKFIDKQFSQKFEKACLKLEKVMGKPIYRNSFTIYLTTFPRGPYNYYKGCTWEYIGWNNPIMGFLHELSHFQFIHYWRNNTDSKVSRLSNEQFEWLKESLTIILDEDFLPLIEFIDNGYEIHESFRKALHKFWETNHDFDKLVDYGLRILPDFVK
jgi:hypothetical protein